MAYLRDRRAFGNIGTRKFRGARFGDPLSPRVSPFTPTVVSTSTVVSNSSDQFISGVPCSTPSFFDGTRYWAFYTESSALKCKYSTDGITWVSSFTDAAGTGNVPGINNGGRAFSIGFGTISSTPFAFGLLNRAAAGPGKSYDIWKWNLTSGGLSFSANVTPSIADKASGHNHITPIYSSGFEVSSLLGVVQDFGAPESVSSVASKSINPSTLANTGMGGGDWATLGYAEINRTFKLSDGFLLFGNDEGGNGDPDLTGHGLAAEKTLTTLGVGAFGSEVNVTGTLFTDQNYAVNESHVGQSGSIQTDDGTVWCAFCDATDTTNGDYGKIHLLSRGVAKSGTWSLVDDDLLSGDLAGAVTLTTDGTNLLICYSDYTGGAKTNKVKSLMYNASTMEKSTKILVANAASGHEVIRLASSYKAHSSTNLITWSEKDGATYDLRSAAISF